MDHRPSTAIALCILLLLASGCGPRGEAGSPGLGDPYAPELGNGGYDVDRYTLALQYNPATNELNGQTIIEARATIALRSFNLDFRGLEVDSIDVDGSAARFERQGRELIITPPRTIRSASAFTVEVDYHGTPAAVKSDLAPSDVGWFHAEDGSVNVMNYPDGASTWFPANDHQIDKASFRYEVTVPEPWIPVAPGTLLEATRGAGQTRFVYEMDKPMYTAAAVLGIDLYVSQAIPSTGGVKITIYVPPDAPAEMQGQFSMLPEALDLFSQAFGPYPFDTYSVIITDPDYVNCSDEYVWADSEQTTTLWCPRSDLGGLDEIIAHEFAHQWFGASVSRKLMQQTWLEEGPATYAGMMWLARDGGLKQIDALVRAMAAYNMVTTAIENPPADNIVSGDVYVGGASLIHTLRLQIGEEAFFKTLRTFTERHQYGVASSADFIAVAEEVSGQDLKALFDSWLYTQGRHPIPNLPE